MNFKSLADYRLVFQKVKYFWGNCQKNEFFSCVFAPGCFEWGAAE